MSTKHIRNAVLVAAICMATLGGVSSSTRPRILTGVVKRIDQENMTLTVMPLGKTSPFVLQWESDTEFIQNHHLISGILPEEGDGKDSVLFATCGTAHRQESRLGSYRWLQMKGTAAKESQ